jgi:hypothetical protein
MLHAACTLLEYTIFPYTSTPLWPPFDRCGAVAAGMFCSCVTEKRYMKDSVRRECFAAVQLRQMDLGSPVVPGSRAAPRNSIGIVFFLFASYLSCLCCVSLVVSAHVWGPRARENGGRRWVLVEFLYFFSFGSIYMHKILIPCWHFSIIGVIMETTDREWPGGR